MIETAILCLALNIYHEARSEPLVGQQAVALVTVNRAQKQNRPVCDVVFAKKQFSWTTKLAAPVKGGYRIKKAGVPKEIEAWKSAVFTARLVLRGKLGDFTYGATHYHRDDVRPIWRHSFAQVAMAGVGRHIFYRTA